MVAAGLATLISRTMRPGPQMGGLVSWIWEWAAPLRKVVKVQASSLPALERPDADADVL
jgi:hypothetical protein